MKFLEGSLGMWTAARKMASDFFSCRAALPLTLTTILLTNGRDNLPKRDFPA